METPRLILRGWQESDAGPFAKINADPAVMKFFPNTLTKTGSDQLIAKIEAHFKEYGFGFYAVELKSNRQFIGFAGLGVPKFSAYFTPCVEIGWRLDRKFWNNGYATEAASAVLNHAFTSLRLEEIVSFTAIANSASRRVMEKLGMSYNAVDNFEHPNLPIDHPLRHHVLYRIKRDEFVC